MFRWDDIRKCLALSRDVERKYTSGDYENIGSVGGCALGMHNNIALCLCCAAGVGSRTHQSWGDMLVVMPLPQHSWRLAQLSGCLPRSANSPVRK
ncbi:unnamed protein product [Alternaria burnsii]|nr:unnamed protein product [Alternaria burnsii]